MIHTNNNQLLGRERRYFGYLRNIRNKVDTPESAKSFRSVISPITRSAVRKYEPVKTFKAEPPKKPRFADKILHQAVKTQIPGLLPALKNSPQWLDDDNGETPIYLRRPDFDHNKERSLHYFWLPNRDRNELCGIFRGHIETNEKTRIRKPTSIKKNLALTGLAAEVAALEQQDYLDQIANEQRIGKLRHRRLTHIPSRVFRMNQKFQPSYWDPTKFKNVPDPFRRARNKVPAFEAICHEHFVQGPDHTELLQCAKDYYKMHNLNQNLEVEEINRHQKLHK